MNNDLPLVSVGIPTYNRPFGLQNTLDHILAQTYDKLEILISDNNSSDPKVQQIASNYARQDSRISSFVQKSDFGPSSNFKFVLEQAHGEYFMWAADDDMWEPFFIERLVAELESLGPNFVAANFEAQYMNENHDCFRFFPEGRAFYTFQSNDVIVRIRHLLTNNYGNLFYSLFRKSVLDTQKLVFSKNEIPFFLQIISKGNWRILPKVGFYKKTYHDVYERARWEKTGGFLGKSVFSNWKSLISSGRYHVAALEKILLSIETLGLTKVDHSDIVTFAKRYVLKHWILSLIGCKTKSTD